MNDIGHWESEFEFEPDEWYGFIYLVTNKMNNMRYIGRKNFRMKRRTKVKNRKNRKITYVKSNWLTYTTSSTHVNAVIEEHGMDIFTFEIIDLCLTKGHLSFRETELQWEHKVLSAVFEDGTPAFYNKQIGAIRFRCDGHTEEARKKISEASKGRKHSDKTKEKISEAKKGRKLSNETKNKMSLYHKGKFGLQHNKSTKVTQIDKHTGEEIACWFSMREIERELNISQSSISNCCNNKQKTAGGFKWKYV